MVKLAEWMDRAVAASGDGALLETIAAEVHASCGGSPTSGLTV